MDAIPEVLANGYINGLKAEMGRVEARLEQESAVLGPNHPQHQRTTAELQNLRAKLQGETRKVVAGLGNAVQTAKKRELELQQAIDAQNQRLLTLKDFRIDMQAMTRDIENAQRQFREAA